MGGCLSLQGKLEKICLLEGCQLLGISWVVQILPAAPQQWQVCQRPGNRIMVWKNLHSNQWKFCDIGLHIRQRQQSCTKLLFVQSIKNDGDELKNFLQICLKCIIKRNFFSVHVPFLKAKEEKLQSGP